MAAVFIAAWLAAFGSLCRGAEPARPKLPRSDYGPLSPISAPALADRASEAVGSFQPVTEDQLEDARRTLAQRAVTLERALGIGSQRGEAWKQYLLWQEVQAQLAAGSELNLRALQATHDRLTSGEQGLDRPEFQQAAAAVQRLLDLGLLRRAKDQPGYLDRQAKVLARYLKRDPAGLDPRATYQTERRLGLLASTDQAPAFTSALRRELAQPNLLGRASEQLLGLLAQRPVYDTRPVQDNILGTRICGTGQTCGQIRLSLAPSSQAARLVFNLSGNVASQTRGYNGPVVIRSEGDTNFYGSKVVELTDERFLVLAADLNAKTQTRTRSINKTGGPFGKRLVVAIAKKKVSESRGQANAIASSKAEQQIAEEFNKQVVEEVRLARERYDKLLSKPLRARGASPQQLAISTSSDTLFVSALQATDRQLGAGSSPPPAIAGDASLRLHQSALNNLANAFLGGATIRRRSADEPTEIDAVLPARLREALRQRVDDQPSADDDQPFKPWSIQLRRERPVSFVFESGAFESGQVRALIHTTQIVSGEEVFRGWDIEVVYRPVREGGRWYAELVGEIDVFPTSFDPNIPGARIASKKRAIRRNLAKQLTARSTEDPNFPRRPEIKPIDFGRLEKPGLNFLSLTDVAIDAGWLSIAFDAN